MAVSADFGLGGVNYLPLDVSGGFLRIHLTWVEYRVTQHGGSVTAEILLILSVRWLEGGCALHTVQQLFFIIREFPKGFRV